MPASHPATQPPRATQPPSQPASHHATTTGMAKNRKSKPVYRRKRQLLTDRQCWAHTMKGSRCTARVQAGEIPYCQRHLESGDGAFKKLRHPDPRLGCVLVARYALPKGYRFVYWGGRTRCPFVHKDDRCLQYLSGQGRKCPNGVINPAGYPGSLAQFANAPAPDELATCHSKHRFWGSHNEKGLVGQEFELLQPLRTNEQVAFNYSCEWWRRRGIKRLRSGCSRYPLPKRPPRPVAISRAMAQARLISSQAQQAARRDALLTLISPVLPLLEGRTRKSSAGALIEYGVGTDGGLVSALAEHIFAQQLTGIQLIGVARSAALCRHLCQRQAALCIDWFSSRRAIELFVPQTDVSVKCIIGARFTTRYSEDLKKAAHKLVRLENDSLALAAHAGRLLHKGGILLVESDTDDDEFFLKWLKLVAMPFGASRATMHKSDMGPSVWVLEKGSDSRCIEELQVEILQH